ncbi:uncharacterized protein LOC132164090 [Corylus avellana]|uniref:uncharacterized protein LOC132164090 n=1 Tax=Corylus avellana TaxID=13451 RepID=UPI001E1EEDF5|nr:uncharacterized protein LOC132164090 [Corylus avellana]
MAKIGCFSLAVLVVAGILLMISSSGNGEQVIMGKGCEGDVLGLASQCEKYVRKSGPKIKPSWGCCAVVKNADVPCVCSLVNKEIEQVIDMEKVVYVARSCGKTVAPGTKCGSYSVPPPQA